MMSWQHKKLNSSFLPSSCGPKYDKLCTHTVQTVQKKCIWCSCTSFMQREDTVHRTAHHLIHTMSTARDSREAEEECGGSDEEGGSCRHRNISAGFKRTGRSRNLATHSSPNTPTAEARHQRWSNGRKTKREVPIYCLATSNAVRPLNMTNLAFAWEMPWITPKQAAHEWKQSARRASTTTLNQIYTL